MASPDHPDILAARDLHVKLGGRPVLRGAGFSARRGRITGILGPNGAGKTTCFRIAAGLMRADSGVVLMGGEDVTRMGLPERARRGLGYLPQEPSVFRGLSVRGNLEAAAELLKIPRAERAARIAAALDEFGLSALADRKSALLSGGERRRVELARLFLGRPSVIMLDEPFAAIDPLAVDDLARLLRNLADKGAAVVITDHSALELLRLCDYLVLLADGVAAAEGSPEEIRRSPIARSRYLGDRAG
ncbi:MAG: Lipopolysaccharide export system ATP-binding protein LptB [Myxococcota bacterium]|nr:Lipopolysaccharide export system ATP-binding protein LptB [Myxococcota bacterium]